MIGRKRDEPRAKQRIGPGGEHLDFAGPRIRVGRGDLEAHLHALGTANPVLLHEPDFFRPAIKRVERLEQILGEIGDLEEPLGQFALNNRRAGAPGLAIDDLFIRQNSLVDRVPIHL